MPSTVHDRDEYLRNHRAEVQRERTSQRREWARTQREVSRGGFRTFWQMLWSTLFHMGMYSDDPQIARIGMIQTAKEQIGIQREITERQRAEDQARDDERMRAMARVMAQEMFNESDRRKATT